MAKNKSMEELEKEITCAVCQEEYTEPKLLDCSHYFCKVCILKLACENGVGHPFHCPLCSHKITLSKEGVNELKPAYFVGSLKSALGTMKHLVQINEQVKPVTDSSCSLSHATCEDTPQSDEAPQRIKEVKEKTKYGILATGHRKELSHLAKSLTDIKTNLTRIIEEIQETKQEVLSHEASLNAALDSSFGCLHDILDNRKKEMVTSLKGITQTKMELLSSQEETLSSNNADILNVLSCTKLLLGLSSDEEFEVHYTDHRSQLEHQIVKHEVPLKNMAPKVHADTAVSVDFVGELQSLCQAKTNITITPVSRNLQGVAVNRVGLASQVILSIRLSSEQPARKGYKVQAQLRTIRDGRALDCDVTREGAGKYLIEYVPVFRGSHELNVSVDDVLMMECPILLFVDIHPAQFNLPMKVWDLPKPSGIAIDCSGNVVITQYYGDVISIKEDGSFHKLAIRPKRHIFSLESLAFDIERNTYCTDRKTNKIMKCFAVRPRVELYTVKQSRGPGHLGIAVYRDEVMICECYNNGEIKIYNRELKFIRSINYGVGEFWGLCVNSLGHIYVADYKNSNIYVFNRDGNILMSFGQEISNLGSLTLNKPHYLCVSNKYIFVSNFGNHCLSVFSLTGQYISSFGKRGQEEGTFETPSGVCVDNDGYVYVADYGNNRIQCF